MRVTPHRWDIRGILVMNVPAVTSCVFIPEQRAQPHHLAPDYDQAVRDRRGPLMQPLGVVRLSMPISLATGASPRSSATQTAPFSRRWASTSPVPTAFGRVRISCDDQR